LGWNPHGIESGFADAIAASSSLNRAPRRLEFGIGAHRSGFLSGARFVRRLRKPLRLAREARPEIDWSPCAMGSCVDPGTTGSPVPEPSTWAMMLLGFAGRGYAGYRRVKAVHAALVE
jgi:hypothetical protein